MRPQEQITTRSMVTVADADGDRVKVAYHSLRPVEGGIGHDRIWRCMKCGKESVDSVKFRSIECDAS